MATKPTIEALELQYEDHTSKADRLRTALVEQINRLIDSNSLTLGVPIESRVKTWASLEEKLSRKSLELNQITDLNDLVGIRIILLFKKDLEIVGELLGNTFSLISKEDTSTRLADGQFGYQSQHYIVSVPQTWAGIPTFADLQGLKVEVQVRTLAQHIWAAASHKLQYKQEESVPPPLRRAIYRASALLETVDLEFERVLEEREIYIAESANKVSPAEPLNVDLLVATLEKMFPPGNRSEGETYGDLLTDLLHFKVNTVDDLVKLLEKNMGAVLEADRETAAKRLNDPAISPRTRSRAEKGLFWSHTGLARQAIKNEFGNPAWLEYFKSKREIKTTINPEPPKAEVAVKGRTSQKPAVRARKPKQAD